MELVETVARTVTAHRMIGPGDNVVVGVSGGPDSLCLLHVLDRLRTSLGFGVHVAHLDHGLRGAESRADAAFVARVARDWSLPHTVETRDVSAVAARDRLSEEEAGRQVRYRFLAEVARGIGSEVVAVGHHADDHVETILMHWLRGAASAGLRGIRPVVDLPIPEPARRVRLVRPFWEVPQSAVDEYCKRHRLRPRLDRTNLDPRYRRNRIRWELLPELETYNPRIRRSLRRAAEVFADDHDFISREADAAWDTLAQQGEGFIQFDHAGWRGLHPSLQRLLLRKGIQSLRPSLRDVGWIQVDQALEAIRTRPAGSQLTLPAGLALSIGYRGFIVGDSFPHPDTPRVPVGAEMGLAVPDRIALDGWTLETKRLPREPGLELARRNQDPWQAFIDDRRVKGRLWVRGRRSGDRFQPLGMGGHSKRVGRFMIDAKIPAHERAEIPIVGCRGHILWIAGYRIDERAKVGDRTEQVLRLRFNRGAPDGA